METKNKKAERYRRPSGKKQERYHTDPNAPLTQAHRIILKFGGAIRMAKVMLAAGIDIHASTIYRWTHPRSMGGGGGVIPAHRWDDVVVAARYDGIVITPEDTDPRPVKCKNVVRTKIMQEPSRMKGLESFYLQHERTEKEKEARRLKKKKERAKKIKKMEKELFS